jgi:hypothetical protein
VAAINVNQSFQGGLWNGKHNGAANLVQKNERVFVFNINGVAEQNRITSIAVDHKGHDRPEQASITDSVVPKYCSA